MTDDGPACGGAPRPVGARLAEQHTLDASTLIDWALLGHARAVASAPLFT